MWVIADGEALYASILQTNAKWRKVDKTFKQYEIDTEFINYKDNFVYEIQNKNLI